MYDGDNTGYEYTYQFVAPIDGVCTVIEYNEGAPIAGGKLFGLIDWFLVSGATCTSGGCQGYMWENKYGDPVCGGQTCSYLSFNVTKGQKLFVVGDIFDGNGAHAGYPYPSGWTLEMKCDAKQKLLLNEDFNDAKCDGCTVAVTAPPVCQGFGWWPVGGFADLVQAFYVGQFDKNTLKGYDCGAAKASVTFPTASLPALVKSCTLSFDYYAEIAPGDEGDCVDDTLSVQLSVNGQAVQLAPGDTCKAKTASSNVLGWSQKPTSKKMTYDVTAFAGKTLGLTLAWVNNATENNGLGALVDNVQIACTVP